METTILRQQLLANITKMCEYAERELAGTTRLFCYKYEHGFIYGHSSYNISFNYYPKTKRAEVAVNYYHGHDYYFRDKVFDRTDGDITQSFFTNMQWYIPCEIQKAMEITQRNWPNIKGRIYDAVREEKEIFNFEV